MKRLTLIYFLLFTPFLNPHSYAQTSCLKMFEEGKKSLQSKNYRAAILKFQAASKCDSNLSREADDQILIVFDKIEALKKNAEKERKAAVRQRKAAEENIDKLSTLIGDITDLLQRDENMSIIGLAPLQNDIFQLILPYHDFITNRSSKTDDNWQVAKAYCQIGSSLESMGKAGFEEKYRQAFEIAFNAIEKCVEKRTNVPEELSITLIDAAVYYSWDLMNQNRFEEAGEILLSTNKLIKLQQSKSAKQFYANSILFNSLSRYYQDKKDIKNAYLFAKKAIENISLANDMDKNNLVYKSSHAVYSRNLDIGLDEFVTEDDKELIDEGCKIAGEIRNMPGSGTLALSTVLQCIYSASFDLVKENKTEKAIQSIENAITELDFHIHLNPLRTSLLLHRARLYTRLSNIYWGLKNKDLRMSYKLKAKDDWVAALKNKTVLPTQVWMVKNVYSDISGLLNLTEDTTQQRQILKDLESAIEGSASRYKNVYDIAYLAGDIYRNLGEWSKTNKADYHTSIDYFNKSIDYFKHTNILTNMDKFSDKYSWYSNVLKQRLQLNYEYGYTDLVLKDFRKINALFTPVLEKYPFAFYTRMNLIGSYMHTGELLMKNKKIAEAKPILEYASKWGGKKSSLQLAQIYREGLLGEVNVSMADSLEKLAEIQSMKKFTVPCYFGKQKSPFDFYVSENPKEYPYKGIDDQVEWLKQARGGIVPSEVIESFRKLHAIALKNKKSFPELCKEALDAANKEKREASKKELQNKLNSNALNSDQKTMEYGNYITKLWDLAKEEAIKGNIDFVVNETEEYVNYLMEKKEIEGAKEWANVLINFQPKKYDLHRKMAEIQLLEYELEKEQNSNVRYNQFLTSKEMAALGVYYRYFLKAKDHSAAYYWQKQILKESNTPAMRFGLLQNQISCEMDLFKSLYLGPNIPELKKDIFYLANQIDKTKSYREKTVFYEYLIKLEHHLLKISPKENMTKTLGRHYNDLAWYQLLTGEFEEAEKNIEKGLKIDPNNLYLSANLPNALLFQGNYGKAKKMYKESKDRPFDSSNRFDTFKDVYLEDFKILKEEGVIPAKYEADVEKIKKLLTQNEGTQN